MAMLAWLMGSPDVTAIPLDSRYLTLPPEVKIVRPLDLYSFKKDKDQRCQISHDEVIYKMRSVIEKKGIVKC